MIATFHKIGHKPVNLGFVFEIHIHQSRGAEQATQHIELFLHGRPFIAIQSGIDQIAFLCLDAKPDPIQNLS